MAEAADGQVAVYIDFDNIVISRYDELHGQKAYRSDNPSRNNTAPIVKQRLLEARLDLGAILDYASSFGTVAISRAYANWADSVNRSYAEETMRRSVDLVQLFPMTGTKNGADIRLAIDVIEDLSRYPRLTHVVVVAGDSDYVALAQRCKRLGRRMIGVGANRSVGKYWRLACHEFRYYSLLPGIADPAIADSDTEVGVAAPIALVEDPAVLLVRALRLGYGKTDSDWLAASGVKVQMKRLDPSFDETALGFSNFTGFLNSVPEVIDVQTRNNGTFLRWKSPPEKSTGQPSVVAGRTAASQVGGGIPRPVFELRQQLAVPVTDGLGLEGERVCVDAIRALWQLADRDTNRNTKIGTTELATELARRGTNGALARRAAHHVLTTGLPLLLRDDSLRQTPNSELVDARDEVLQKLLRHWAANRARNRSYPESVDTGTIAVALYGNDIPEGALADLQNALDRPGYAQMVDSLGPMHLAAPVLWAVAAAVTRIPPTTPLRSLDGFAEAIAKQLRDRDDGWMLDGEQMTAAFLSLDESGVLAALGRSQPFDTTAQWSDEEVVQHVLQRWSARLNDDRLLDASDILQREAFYRMALEDRTRSDWRNWVRRLIDPSWSPQALPTL
ncbi:NYN domain-containing protein [Rhodococcus ruber]|uniref:NYN domain-containing protein n=1 Tax=Rhodococcus ruber TaxID=1830 RepID=UPI00387DC65B